MLTLRHIIGVLLLTLMALCLVGCSAVQFGYQQAPELAYWWLDSYLDFNESQSLKLRADLTALQAWHRQTELPIYIKTLDKLRKMAPLDATPEQVCGLYTEFKTRLQVTLDQFEPTVSAIAPALTPGQIDHLTRQFEKRNQKWHDEWIDLTQAQRHARRFKQMKERSEGFYGRLEEQQLGVLRNGLLATPLDMSLSYQESQRRQQDILQTLRQLQGAKPGAPSVQVAMRGVLERSIDSPDPAYRAYMEKVTQAQCRTFAALHNSSTPAQRLHLFETLKDYQTDARDLLGAKQ